MRTRLLWLFLPLLAIAQEPVAVFGTTVVIPSGLRGEIYYLRQTTETLADLAHLRPQGTIYTTSLNVPPQDDGAMLYIDGQLIADNDGVHSTSVRLGSIRLAGGTHTIRVPYFQGPGKTVALMLEIAGPGAQPRIFDTDEFKPPTNPEE
jgi:hypothetical protein